MDVKTTCLGVLALGEASGYEIRKAFEEGPFSHFADGGYGSIYPALNRLTDEGLVTCNAQSQPKRPDKKVYAITQAGRERLFEALQVKSPGEDKYKSDLLFMLFFADALDPRWIEKVLDERIRFYRDKMAKMRECGVNDETPTGRRLTHGFGLAVYGAALDYLVAHREEFIEAAEEAAKGKTTGRDAAE